MTNFVFDTSSTNYSVEGGGLDSKRNYAVQITAGSLALSGAQLNLSKLYQLAAVTSEISLTASSIDILEIYVLSQLNNGTNAFALTGGDANFIGTKKVSLSTAVFTYSGAFNRFAVSYGIFATQTGAFTLQGGNPPLVYNEVFTLPSVVPSKREFVPASFSFHTTTSLNGHTVRKLNASVEGGAELRLGFENLEDQDILDLLNTYNRTYGNYFYVTVPQETYEGADAALQVYLKLQNTQMKWAFTEAPSIETTAPGYHNVSFTLRSRITATRRFALSDAEVAPDPEPIVYGPDWLEVINDFNITSSYSYGIVNRVNLNRDLATDFSVYAQYSYPQNILVMSDITHTFDVNAQYTQPQNILAATDLVHSLNITSIV